MRKIIILITVLLSYTIHLNGQNFQFIGKNSYPSTKKFVLESNSDDDDIGNLNLAFSKKNKTSLVIVSSKLSSSVKIAKDLIIYLDDGTAISCTDRGINDNVDGVAIAAYQITALEVNKLKNSNINSIRFEIICPVCAPVNSWEGAYSASNKGKYKTNFTEVVKNFYN